MTYHGYNIIHENEMWIVDLGDECAAYDTLQDAKDFVDTF